MEIAQNTPLKAFNTFGISAAARYFIEVSDIETLKEVLSNKSYTAVDKLILGGGSNILFTHDVNALVIKNRLKGIAVEREDEDFVWVKSAAGEVWHEFVLDCIANSRAGLENLSLIPGCVGAAPMQNIGAYGVEIKDTFYELEALNINTLELVKFSAGDCEFGYRESVFKRKHKGEFVITNVGFKLSKKPKFNVSYGAIEKELERLGVKEISIKAISDAVISIRRSKLPDPRITGNAGSFFKNPVVSVEKFNQLKTEYPDVVGYSNSESEVKLAAGWLIEKAGWKGFRKGDAGVHTLQALVLVNYGNATGKEIYNLSTEILKSIHDKFGVELEREVNIL